MATCKDCVHDKVCREYLRAFWGHMSNKHSDLINAKPEDCPYFKARSRFVELPCNVGDFVYFIKARRVMADIVSKFTIDRCGVMLQRVNGYNLGYTDQLGKKIFLTLEEAEQALKEREENETDN